MTSLNQLKKDLETVKRAIQPKDTQRTDEIRDLLRKAENLADWNSPIWKDAAKEVVRLYAEGKIT